MNDDKKDCNKDFEYEEWAGLDLPLEMTEEESEIAKMLVDSAKPIENIYLWRTRIFISSLIDKFLEVFVNFSRFIRDK